MACFLIIQVVSVLCLLLNIKEWKHPFWNPAYNEVNSSSKFWYLFWSHLVITLNLRVHTHCIHTPACLHLCTLPFPFKFSTYGLADLFQAVWSTQHSRPLLYWKKCCPKGFQQGISLWPDYISSIHIKQGTASEGSPWKDQAVIYNAPWTTCLHDKDNSWSPSS